VYVYVYVCVCVCVFVWKISVSRPFPGKSGLLDSHALLSHACTDAHAHAHTQADSTQAPLSLPSVPGLQVPQTLVVRDFF
jgi:hypothetical protein